VAEAHKGLTWAVMAEAAALFELLHLTQLSALCEV
jgi:hypothetical protein